MFKATVNNEQYLKAHTAQFKKERAKLFMGEASLADITTTLEDGSQVKQNIKGVVNHQFDNALIDLGRDSYQLITNKQLVERFFDASKELDMDLRINKNHSYVKPERMRLSLMTDKVIFNDGESDVIQCIELINSYNRTFSVGIKFSAVRVICMNGMIESNILAQTRAKHTKGLDINALVENLMESEFRANKMAQSFERLIDTKVDMDEIETAAWLRTYIGAKGSRLAVEAMGGDMPKTQWDLYNAATYYITHHSNGGEGALYKNIKLSKALAI